MHCNEYCNGILSVDFFDVGSEGQFHADIVAISLTKDRFALLSGSQISKKKIGAIILLDEDESRDLKRISLRKFMDRHEVCEASGAWHSCRLSEPNLQGVLQCLLQYCNKCVEIRSNQPSMGCCGFQARGVHIRVGSADVSASRLSLYAVWHSLSTSVGNQLVWRLNLV